MILLSYLSLIENNATQFDLIYHMIWADVVWFYKTTSYSPCPSFISSHLYLLWHFTYFWTLWLWQERKLWCSSPVLWLAARSYRKSGIFCRATRWKQQHKQSSCQDDTKHSPRCHILYTSYATRYIFKRQNRRLYLLLWKSCTGFCRQKSDEEIWLDERSAG